jgi:NitT/TauT family transport system permease protein
VSDRVFRQVVLPTGAFVLLLVVEGAVALLQIQQIVLPRPSAIAVTMVEMARPIVFHATQTLYTTLVGFVLAVVLGLGLGFAIGASMTVHDALYPLLVGFNSIPNAAVVPLLVMWFGVGTVPAVITAFLLAFFPVAVNVALGLATLEAARRPARLGASSWQIFVKVGAPRTMPMFFASLGQRPLRLRGFGHLETVAANAGIGYLMAWPPPTSTRGWPSAALRPCRHGVLLYGLRGGRAAVDRLSLHRVAREKRMDATVLDWLDRLLPRGSTWW